MKKLRFELRDLRHSGYTAFIRRQRPVDGSASKRRNLQAKGVYHIGLSAVSWPHPSAELQNLKSIFSLLL